MCVRQETYRVCSCLFYAADAGESYVTDTLELSRRLMEVMQRTPEDDVEHELYNILASKYQ